MGYVEKDEKPDAVSDARGPGSQGTGTPFGARSWPHQLCEVDGGWGRSRIVISGPCFCLGSCIRFSLLLCHHLPSSLSFSVRLALCLLTPSACACLWRVTSCPPVAFMLHSPCPITLQTTDTPRGNLPRMLISFLLSSCVGTSRNPASSQMERPVSSPEWQEHTRHTWWPAWKITFRGEDEVGANTWTSQRRSVRSAGTEWPLGIAWIPKSMTSKFWRRQMRPSQFGTILPDLTLHQNVN